MFRVGRGFGVSRAWKPGSPERSLDWKACISKNPSMISGT